MTGRDRWGHECLYADGTFAQGKPDKGKELVYMSHYSENDGWAFRRGDVDRKLIIEIGKGVTCQQLEQLLQNVKINSQAKKYIDEMIKKGELKSKVFDVD